MQKTIHKAGITDRASYHIISQYGWKPQACFEVICTVPGYRANTAAMLDDVEAILWRTVKGRIYHYDETLVRDLDCGIVVVIYFEHQEDALLFKLAVD